jgi:serine/threonine protein kinase
VSSEHTVLTDYVATRWYRAPELLLGPPFRDDTGREVRSPYGKAVDMWAVRTCPPLVFVGRFPSEGLRARAGAFAGGRECVSDF